MKNISVSIKNISKKFGDKWALKDLNLDVHEGEIFGVLGPNGAGKTTTIKLMTGLLKPTEGTIHVKGSDIQKEADAAKKKFAL